MNKFDLLSECETIFDQIISKNILIYILSMISFYFYLNFKFRFELNKYMKRIKIEKKNNMKYKQYQC